MFKEVKSLLNLNWIYILFIITIFWIGEVNLFSAANGSLDPWAKKQLVRFSIFLPIFFPVNYFSISSPIIINQLILLIHHVHLIFIRFTVVLISLNQPGMSSN